MASDHNPIVVDQFMGLYARGPWDIVPADHSIDCKNLLFSPRSVQTRYQFIPADATIISAGNRAVSRFHFYKRSTESQYRVIALDAASGKFYDLSQSTTVPILTVPGAIDFSMHTMYDRAYITPHDRNSGISDLVYIYDPFSFNFGPAYGAILSLTINAGGAGYTVNDIITISSTLIPASGFTYATIKVLTLGGGGSVATFSLQVNGTGYYVANGLATVGGTGAGFKVNVTSIQIATRAAAGLPPAGTIVVSGGVGPGLLTYSLHLNGYWYMPGDILQVLQGNNAAQIYIDTVDSNRTIVASHVIAPGSGYSVANNINTTPVVSTYPDGVPVNEIIDILSVGTAGNIEAGDHIFAVAYGTDTGYITQPSPRVKFTCAASSKVDLSSIPIGPPGTIKRYILASKSIANYSGKPDDYVLYFVPNAVINDNTTTTFAGVSFFDADLQDSADYLLDQLAVLPAGLAIGEYRNRLIIGNTLPNPSVLYVSVAGSPESIDSTVGLLPVNIGDYDLGIKNFTEARGLFYVHKSRHVYVTNDNGQDPIDWSVTMIDASAGTTVFGIGQVLGFEGPASDIYLVASQRGLIFFNGTFQGRELTWKINDIWKRIPFNYFNQLQCYIDPIGRKIYLSVPLDADTAPSTLLVGDYQLGLDPDKIRWMIYTSLACTSILSLLIYPQPTAGSQVGQDAKLILTDGTTIFMSSPTSVVYHDIAAGAVNKAIDSYIQTALLDLDEEGDILHINGIQARIKGLGTLAVTAYDADQNVLAPAITSLTLETNPARERFIFANIIAERVSFKLRTNAVDEYSSLMRLVVGAKRLWTNRAVS